MSKIQATQVGPALRILHELTEMFRSPFSEPPLSPAARFQGFDFDTIAADAARAKDLLARINALDLGALPHDMVLTLRMGRFMLRYKSQEADWYWHVFSPFGPGFYSMFAPTNYCLGIVGKMFAQAMSMYRFETAGDLDRYLALIADFAAAVDHMAARTKGQAERGIHMPKVQLAQAMALLPGLRAMLFAAVSVRDERLGAFANLDFTNEVARRLDLHLGAAFDSFVAIFDADYQRQAPDTVGLGQYPGGDKVYAELVRLNTTMDMTAEQVHQAGLARMTTIRQAMSDLRESIGFAGNDKDYLAALEADPAWRADTVEGISAVFQRYIDRLKPKYDELFDFPCPKPYGVAPLAKALEAGMTFGYYDPPRPGKDRGEYVFNAANLAQNSLFNLGSLGYHELVPGHHLHLSVQKENQTVHPLHNILLFGAFNEGWAEYSATLAGEVGMYEEPAEKFGRMVMDAFLTCRLVVDTGMNAFGWSLEQARDYMRENAFMPEKEICSESVRYSCDIPGQALAYKLGDTEMLRLRDKMRERLGNRFDIKDFHRAVLHPGALPFPDLEWHIDHTIAEIAAA